MITDDAFEELPEHEPAWAALDRVTAYRKQLLASGYSPVPVNGKRINLSDWQNIRATPVIIDMWAITRADHLNTGVLCRDTPFIDIDVTVEEVAEEIEALLDGEIENSAVRIGLPPKRAIPFRTDVSFKKIATQFRDANGLVHKVEVLGDGQQIVVNGIHPDTHEPYRWHGGEPGPKLKREDLPLMTAATAATFIAAAADIMRAHGWEEVGNKRSNGGAGTTAGNTGTTKRASARERAYAQAALDGCAEELADTVAGDRNNILYKKSFRCGTMVGAGWIVRSEVEAALFDAAAACGLVTDDGERQVRRTIQSGLDDGASAPHPDLPDQDALQVTAVEQQEAPPRCSLADAHAVFKKWLGDEYDLDAASAAIAAAASERLPGDPLWLLIVAGPGGAKTETVQALMGCGAHVTSTIASEGALLSATPRRERNKKATGGLLRKIGDRGVLVIKDVTSDSIGRPQHPCQRSCRYSGNLRRQVGKKRWNRWRRHADLGGPHRHCRRRNHSLGCRARRCRHNGRQVCPATSEDKYRT